MVGFFTLSWEVSHLTERKNRISKQLFRMNRELTKFKDYAAIIGTGSISIGAMLSAPAGYSQQLMGYLNYAHNASSQYMYQNAPAMMQMYMQNTTNNGQVTNPKQQTQMQAYIYKMLYSQAREKIKEAEQKRIQQIEHKMEKEKERLETDLKICEEQLNYAKQQKDNSLKEMMPKYA